MNPDDFRRLVAAGLTSDQIAVVMEIMAAGDEDRKAKQRARWRKHQQNKKNTNISQREQTLANVPRVGVTRVEDKTSNTEIEPQEQEERKREPSSLSSPEFDEFWGVFPNKVGKPAAKLAFAKARKRATFEAIMAGLRVYAAKLDDRPWLNPSTFLNQDRWEDRPATVVPMARGSPAVRGVEALRQQVRQEIEDGQRRDSTEGFDPRLDERVSYRRLGAH